MEWYEAEVRALEAAIRGRRTPGNVVAFYGSSSIRLWTDLVADLKDPRAFNLGFGGSTMAACAHFFDRLVPALHPVSLVLYAGDNDLGDGRSPEDVLASFRSLVGKLQRSLPRIPLGFMSIKISPARFVLRDRIQRTNALIRAELERRSDYFYIDIVAAMLDSDGRPRPELFLEDGLHLSRAGYQVWTRVLEPYRNQIFIPQSQEISTPKLSFAR